MQNAMFVQRMVWLGMILSLGVYGAFAAVATPSGEPAPHIFLAVFIGASVMVLVAVQIMRPKLLPPMVAASSLDQAAPPADTPEARAALGKLFTANLVTWALCESVAIFGFMATFLLHQMVFYVGFAAVSLVFLVLHRPDPEDYLGALRAAHKG